MSNDKDSVIASDFLCRFEVPTDIRLISLSVTENNPGLRIEYYSPGTGRSFAVHFDSLSSFRFSDEGAVLALQNLVSEALPNHGRFLEVTKSEFIEWAMNQRYANVNLFRQFVLFSTDEIIEVLSSCSPRIVDLPQ